MVVAQDVGKEAEEGLCLVSTECRFVKIPNSSPSWMNDPIPKGMGNYTIPSANYGILPYELLVRKAPKTPRTRAIAFGLG